MTFESTEATSKEWLQHIQASDFQLPKVEMAAYGKKCTFILKRFFIDIFFRDSESIYIRRAEKKIESLAGEYVKKHESWAKSLINKYTTNRERAKAIHQVSTLAKPITTHTIFIKKHLDKGQLLTQLAGQSLETLNKAMITKEFNINACIMDAESSTDIVLKILKYTDSSLEQVEPDDTTIQDVNPQLQEDEIEEEVKVELPKQTTEEAAEIHKEASALLQQIKNRPVDLQLVKEFEKINHTITRLEEPHINIQKSLVDQLQGQILVACQKLQTTIKKDNETDCLVLFYHLMKALHTSITHTSRRPPQEILETLVAQFTAQTKDKQSLYQELCSKGFKKYEKNSDIAKRCSLILSKELIRGLYGKFDTQDEKNLTQLYMHLEAVINIKTSVLTVDIKNISREYLAVHLLKPAIQDIETAMRAYDTPLPTIADVQKKFQPSLNALNNSGWLQEEARELRDTLIQRIQQEARARKNEALETYKTEVDALIGLSATIKQLANSINNEKVAIELDEKLLQFSSRMSKLQEKIPTISISGDDVGLSDTLKNEMKSKLADCQFVQQKIQSLKKHITETAEKIKLLDSSDSIAKELTELSNFSKKTLPASLSLGFITSSISDPFQQIVCELSALSGPYLVKDIGTESLDAALRQLPQDNAARLLQNVWNDFKVRPKNKPAAVLEREIKSIIGNTFVDLNKMQSDVSLIATLAEELLRQKLVTKNDADALLMSAQELTKATKILNQELLNSFNETVKIAAHYTYQEITALRKMPAAREQKELELQKIFTDPKTDLDQNLMLNALQNHAMTYWKNVLTCYYAASCIEAVLQKQTGKLNDEKISQSNQAKAAIQQYKNIYGDQDIGILQCFLKLCGGMQKNSLGGLPQQLDLLLNSTANESDIRAPLIQVRQNIKEKLDKFNEWEGNLIAALKKPSPSQNRADTKMHPLPDPERSLSKTNRNQLQRNKNGNIVFSQREALAKQLNNRKTLQEFSTLEIKDQISLLEIALNLPPTSKIRKDEALNVLNEGFSDLPYSEQLNYIAYLEAYKNDPVVSSSYALMLDNLMPKLKQK